MTALESELRSLRARAYGPGADIHTDPAALARLAELEDALRPAPAPPPLPESRAAPVAASPAISVGEEPAASTPDDTPAAGAPAAAPPASPRRRRRLVLAWALSLIAALVLGAVAASATVRLVSRDPDATQVAVLELRAATSSEWPSFLGPQSGDARVSSDFWGMSILVNGSGAWMGDEADECAIVVATDQLGSESSSLSGPSYFNCGSGAFPATVQFRVTTELPDALRARFPVGSALQFVVDGDRVGVFSDAE